MHSKQVHEFTCACEFTGAIYFLEHNGIYIAPSIKIYISLRFCTQSRIE
jgi:hypothetical protein